MNTVSLLCVDNQSLIVDVESIRDRCPPVLLRFLGAVDGFKAPPTNAEGQLVFAQEYGITRLQMAACVIFIRSGAFIISMEELMEVFTIFGGCDALDEWYAAREAAQEIMKQAKQENPLNPSEDVMKMFSWATHEAGWGVEEGWDCMSSVKYSAKYWYRKRNE